MTYPPNSSPGAPDEAWSTPVRPGTMPVSALVATNDPAPGGQPIYVGGDADAGGRDIVGASVAESVSNAQARYGELQGDTYGQGSHIGDLLDLPPVVADMSKHTGSPGSPLSGPAG